MTTKKKFILNDWTKLCQDGFVMSYTCGDHDWSEKITDQTKINIHLGSAFKHTPPQCYYTYESQNGFNLLQIYNLMNNSYFRYCDEYCDSDYDMISHIALIGFKIVDGIDVYCDYGFCGVATVGF